MWNEDFLNLFPAITVNKFAAVELKMLNLMQFEVCVVSSEFFTHVFVFCCFSLLSLSESLVLCRGVLCSHLEERDETRLEEETLDARRGARSRDSHAGPAVARQGLGEGEKRRKAVKEKREVLTDWVCVGETKKQRCVAREGGAEECHIRIKNSLLSNLSLSKRSFHYF